jgi:hypothetical protein
MPDGIDEPVGSRVASKRFRNRPLRSDAVGGFGHDPATADDHGETGGSTAI